MIKTIIKISFGLFAAAFAGNMLLAQQMPEVTVQASRIVEKQAGRTSSGLPIVDVSLSYGVSYSGLDLSTYAGVTELEKRVKDAAMKACEELSRQYPMSTTTDAECAKSATNKAMVKVHELAAAAAPKK
ncbi:MAG: UrcA family protein [Steroidobacteraceae bacterium]